MHRFLILSRRTDDADAACGRGVRRPETECALRRRRRGPYVAAATGRGDGGGPTAASWAVAGAPAGPSSSLVSSEDALRADGDTDDDDPSSPLSVDASLAVSAAGCGRRARGPAPAPTLRRLLSPGQLFCRRPCSQTTCTSRHTRLRINQ